MLMLFVIKSELIFSSTDSINSLLSEDRVRGAEVDRWTR